MELRILGPLEVADGSHRIEIAGRRQEALLALLLLHRNEVVASDWLLEELWGERASPSSHNALQAAVSRLRRALPGERVLTRSSGYLIRLGEGELDADRFERLLEQGTAALAEGDAERAAVLLREALLLWRGPALADFLYEPFAQTEIARLEELRLDALEERFDADLALGRHAALVPEIEALAAEHPLRERLRGQLMLALYRSGRQAEALEEYRETRTLLLDELGLEPGPELRELERRILAQDPTLDLRVPPRPAAAPSPSPPTAVPETRRTVTVLFCDLADSTGLTERLDPEVLREVLGRYASAASEAVAGHGGTMEKFIGDAVVAVFGVPRLHEDDALRATRAAVELRDRIAELDRDLDLQLRVRIGIETGEVVSGDERPGEALVTGPAVTTAARLEQQAAPGEILLGEATRRLVGPSARVEPRGELRLKGKRVEVTAWNLVALVAEAPPFARRLQTPLVGREVELAQLRQSFARAVRERSPHLFTVLGPAGIGKTRLARELTATLAAEATVLVGRCLSYGDGITFWPLREILVQTPESDLRSRVAVLMGDQLDEGLAGTGAATTEEIFVAARRLLEAKARERPLVLVLEDLHWADPTFLDFVEYVARRARDAPILLFCLARGELLELRETWGGGMENASSLRLEPLADEETELLLDALEASGAARARIRDVAEGNPLFVEQMLAWLEEVGYAQDERGLPPTIQALLAARLDRLGPAEAAVLHRAAVIGRDFERDALLALLPSEARATAPRHLDALARKGLVRPLESDVDEGESFRFVHALVHDAAYRMVPKRLRAELHERFADWLEAHVADRVSEYEEIVGYHLERSVRYLAELGAHGDETKALAGRAGKRLASAGSRAAGREDYPAAASLLSRALDLTPAQAPRRRDILIELGVTVAGLGEVERGERLLSEAIEEARVAGDRLAETHARLELEGVRTFSRAGEFVSQRREAERALEVFGEAGDERGLARAWSLLAWVERTRGRLSSSEEAYTRSLEHARRARAPGDEVEALRRLAALATVGPTPVGTAVARCEAIVELVAGRPRAEGSALIELGVLRAFQGRFDQAEALLERGRDLVEEAGDEMVAAWASGRIARVKLLAGDPAAAERELRPAYEAYERFGNRTDLAFCAIVLAEAACDLGRYDEALELTSLADDWHSFARARAYVQRARAFAGLGRLAEAERMAREAASFLDQTEVPMQRARAHQSLAEILRAAGRTAESVEHAAQALRLYEDKGVEVYALETRALLAELAEPATAR